MYEMVLRFRILMELGPCVIFDFLSLYILSSEQFTIIMVNADIGGMSC